MEFSRKKYDGLAGFRVAIRRFLSASEIISHAGGVTAQQYQALLAIGCSEKPMTMKDLAGQLLLQSHAAVQMVNRLALLELVVRMPSPSDGRSVLLKLTDSGISLLENLAEAHLKELLKQEPLMTDSLRKVKNSAHAID